MIRKTLMALSIMLLSSSAFAGYISLTGNIERFSMGGAKWNTAGGGIGIGMSVSDMVSFEPYFDFMKHISPQNMLGVPGVDVSMYSMHFGGKITVELVKIVYVKFGAGLARTNMSTAASSTSGNNFELVANAGVRLPLAPTMSFTAGLTYRKIFESDAGIYAIGGQAGIMIDF
jgi:hypothetical protein